MYSRIFSLIIGIALVGLGVIIFFTGGFYLPIEEQYIEFGRYHIIAGIIFGLFGILFLYASLRRKAKIFEDKLMICPKCEETHIQKSFSNQRCPRCNVNLEEIEGFYDRHPELRTEENLGSKTELRN